MALWPLLALLLALLTGAAGAQELRAPVALSDQPLAVGETVRVQLEPGTDLINLDPSVVEARQVGPGILELEGRRAGEAVLLLSRQGLTEPLLVQVSPSAPEDEGTTHGGTGYDVPHLRYQGAVGAITTAGVSQLHTQHGLGYAHERPGEPWSNHAQVVVARPNWSPGWQVPSLFVDVRRAQASGRLGDSGVVLAENLATSMVRGAQLRVHPTSAPVTVTSTVGPTVSGGLATGACCGLIGADPDLVWATRARVEPRPGVWTEVGGGVVGTEGQTRGHGQLAAGAMGPWGVANAEVARVGEGSAALAQASVAPSETVRIDARVQGATSGTLLPGLDPLDRDLVVARTAVGVRPKDWLRLQPLVSFDRRGRAPGLVRRDQLGAGLTSEVRTPGATVLDAGYVRGMVWEEGASSRGTHTLRAGARTPSNQPVVASVSSLATLADTGRLDVLLLHGEALVAAGQGWSAGPRAWVTRTRIDDDALADHQDWFGAAAVANKPCVQSRLEAGWWRTRAARGLRGGPQWLAEVGWRVTDPIRLDVITSGAHLPGSDHDLLRGDLVLTVEGPLRAPRGLGLGGRVTGIAFHDLDADGVPDSEEQGLEGLVVSAFGRSAVTGPDGRFVLSGLPPGEHRIQLDRGEWLTIDGVDRDVEVGTWGSAEVAFALARGATLQVRVFHDRDRDGRLGADEPGVDAGGVTVVDPEGDRRQLSAPGGVLVVSDLARGTYEVEVDALGLPAGYLPVSGLRRQIAIDARGVATVWVPLRANRALGGRVWVDVNGNGSRDGADEPAANVLVRTSTGLEARTDAQGRYLFREVDDTALTVEAAGAEPVDVRFPDGPAELLRVDLRVDPSAPAETLVEASPVALRVSPPVVFLWARDRVALSATATYADLSQRPAAGVSFAVADPGIARLEGQELVGVRTGRTTVTASLDGLVSPPIEVEVAEIPLVGLSARPSSISVEVGQTAALSASVLYVTGDWFSTGALPWRSDDPHIASVDDAGIVTGHTPGTTVVRASLEAIETRVQVSVTLDEARPRRVTVTRVPPVVPLDGTGTLGAELVLVDGRAVDGTALVTWEVADPNVVEVLDGGRLRPLRAGSTRVAATWRGVRSLEVPLDIAAPVGLTLVSPPAVLLPGTRSTLRARAVLEQGGVTDVGDVVLSSLDPTVLAVEGDEVVAVAPGTARVVAELGALRSLPVSIEVVPGPVGQLRSSQRAVELAAGTTTYIDLVARLDAGRELPVRTDVAWVVADPTIATVDASGVLTAARAGRTTVTAAWQGVVTDPITVTVRPPEPPRRVEVVPDRVEVPLGSTRRLRAEARLPGGDRARPDDGVTWRSSDPGVVVVDERGFLLPGASGRAEVVATWLGVSSRPAVVEVVDLVGLVIAPSLRELPVGARVDLTARGVHADGTAEPLGADVPVCSPSGGDVVRVSPRNELLAVRAGRATVTCAVGVVEARPLDIRVIDSPVDALTVTPDRVDASPGDTVELAVRGVLASGEVLADPIDRLVSWSSSRPDVADVDYRGVVRTFGEGSAVLQPSWQGVLGPEIIVRVLPDDVVGLRVRAPELARSGQTLRLVVEGLRDGAAPHVLTERVTWEVAPVGAATVSDEGVVSATTTGPVTFVASIGSTRSEPVTVLFSDAAVRRLRVDAPEGLTSGGVWVPVVTATFADGTEAVLGPEQVTWETVGPGVVVDRFGRISVPDGVRATVRAAAGEVRSRAVVVEVP